MKRLDISKSVTSPLESLLAGTRSQWLRVAPPRPVSYELFSSWDIPKKEIVSMLSNPINADLPRGIHLNSKEWNDLILEL